MVAIAKPDYTYLWASGGNKVTPPDVKIQTGWIAEPPPYQYENWSQNRQDQAIAHIFQRGIAQWDSLTNYEANICYVTGTDGLVYKSVAASGPAAVVQDPVTDASDTYWTIAFASPGAFLTQAAGDARYLQKANNLSDVPNIVTARTNLSVYSKAESDDLFSQSGIVGAFSNLKLSATGTSALVNITADELVVKNYTNNRTRIIRSVVLNPSTAVSGNGGIDTGSSTTNTWYSVWVIYNETTNTQSAILSLSATTPTMPSGYTYRARVGWIRTDNNSSNKYPLGFIQNGKSAKYKVVAGSNVPNYPTAASGVAGSASIPTYATVSLSNYLPSTAFAVVVMYSHLQTDFSINAIISSTNQTGNLHSATNPPEWAFTNNTNGGTASYPIKIQLDTLSLYWANNNGNGNLRIIGWEDN